MKLYISADIEGITGVTADAEHGSDDGRQHADARRWMTQDVNAAVEGALEAGADEIVVKDAHGSALNIVPEELHPAATLIQGWGPVNGMMEGLDATCDLAFLVGYHAMVGTENGVLAHTWSGAVRGVWLNGLEIGEMGLSALFAGHFGVPVGLVTSCEAGIRQAQALLPWAQTAAVKRGLARSCAALVPPAEARARIRTAAAAAVRGREQMQPWRPDMPCTVEMQFHRADPSIRGDLVPGVERVPPYGVRFQGADALAAQRLVMLMMRLT